MIKGKDYPGIGIGVILTNEQGNILLMRRGDAARHQRGMWDLPGGGVKLKETLLQAVHREMREELGVDVTIIAQYPARDDILSEEGHHWVTSTFVGFIKVGQVPRIMEPEKCTEIGWFSIRNLPEPLTPITQHELAYYEKIRLEY